MTRFDIRAWLAHPTNQSGLTNPTDFKTIRSGLEPALTMLLFMVLFLACFVGDVGAGVKSAPTNNQPIIRFDQEKVDLGKITRGEIVEHVFFVYNDGTTPLKILKLNPS